MYTVTIGLASKLDLNVTLDLSTRHDSLSGPVLTFQSILACILRPWTAASPHASILLSPLAIFKSDTLVKLSFFSFTLFASL